MVCYRSLGSLMPFEAESIWGSKVLHFTRNRGVYTSSQMFDRVLNTPLRNFLTNIYLFKVNNRNTGKRCEICSKLTIKGAYFNVRKMKNIECRNRVILSFKIRVKYEFSLSINQIYRKNLNINNIFIFLLFAYQVHMHFGLASSTIQ